MKTVESTNTFVSGTFPDTLAIDSTGASSQDGFEYVSANINNLQVGPQQAMMDYAAGNSNPDVGTVGVPNGVTEAAGFSQLIEAMHKSFGIGPGTIKIYMKFLDPSVTGDRILLLQGQGVLVSTFLDLTAAVYTGDGNNATIQSGGGAFYKSSTADGLNPVDGGAFLILPEGRGYALRGLDLAAAVDPDGAARLLGDNQIDAFQGHKLAIKSIGNNASSTATHITHGNTTGGQLNQLTEFAPLTDGVNGTPRTNSETRMSNLSVQYGITY